MKGPVMFGSLFLSKNQKLVKKWKKEHEQIVVLATKVIGEYSKNNPDAAKKQLIALNELAVDHLMNEDIEFYRLLKDARRADRKTEEAVNEFTKSFKGIKLPLMNFLTIHSRDKAVLDEKFFEEFNELIDALGERIAFEEDNLYLRMAARD